MARGNDRVHNAGGNITGLNYNVNMYTPAAKTTIETALADAPNNIIAKVMVGHGDGAGAGSADYVRIKFIRNGKAFATYKSKNYVQADAIAFRNEVLAANP